MINRQFIAELSTKLQTSEQNIAREYCQHVFLSYLYKKPKTENLLFKGGTALRIVFDSPRFSEDLDFSAKDLSVNEINILIDEVLSDLNAEGIETERQVNPGTEGETSGGYFAIINLKLLEFDSEIKIQVSFRDKENLESNSALIQNDFIPPYTIVYLAERLFVGEKIKALLERAKPRDFFDLYFILRHPELARLIPKDIDNFKNKIFAILDNGWETELKVFLPTSHHPLLADFKERLVKEIETRIPNH